MNKIVTDESPIITGKYVTKTIAYDRDRVIYHKDFSLNELIGSRLGKIRNLNVCDYFLFKSDNSDNIEIGS